MVWIWTVHSLSTSRDSETQNICPSALRATSVRFLGVFIMRFCLRDFQPNSYNSLPHCKPSKTGQWEGLETEHFCKGWKGEIFILLFNRSATNLSVCLPSAREDLALLQRQFRVTEGSRKSNADQAHNTIRKQQ